MTSVYFLYIRNVEIDESLCLKEYCILTLRRVIVRITMYIRKEESVHGTPTTEGPSLYICSSIFE